MGKVTYIQPDGTKNQVELENGATVMEGAVQNGVAGIDADCGGACACATCHVYIDSAWTDKTGKPNDMEEGMLDFASEVKDESRLSCQITMSDDIDGIVVYLPQKQF